MGRWGSKVLNFLVKIHIKLGTLLKKKTGFFGNFSQRGGGGKVNEYGKSDLRGMLDKAVLLCPRILYV